MDIKACVGKMVMVMGKGVVPTHPIPFYIRLSISTPSKTHS